MIRVQLTNEILKRITAIEENKFKVGNIEIPKWTYSKLKKNSKKNSSYASNKIEGSPLTEEQADAAVDADPHRHFLAPEQEIRNYYEALEFLEECAAKNIPFSNDLILKVQAIVEKESSKEKIGLRGPMPPGYVFGVYDSVTGNAEYIPPEYSEVPELMEELVDHVNNTDDHPLITAAIVQYQLVTIHPFEDGNGRTARLLSGYILDTAGYGFKGIGSLEEYFAYDQDEYYRSLQMDLPALYYSGRNDPPDPEIWVNYFLRMVELYSAKVSSVAERSIEEDLSVTLSHLSKKEKDFLKHIISNRLYEFTPIEVSKTIGVTNKTAINRCVKLAENGFLIPVLVKERVRSYKMSDYTKENMNGIESMLK